MEEKSGNTRLEDVLDELGLNHETYATNKTLVLSSEARHINTRCVIAPLGESIYFIAYDSGTSSRFTGIYSTIELPEEAEYKVYKRSWFDIFIIFKSRRSGIKYIDDHLTIVANKWDIAKQFSAENVDLFLKLNEKESSFCLILQNNYLPVIGMFKDKKVIGVETYRWLFKKEDIIPLLETGLRLLSNIKHNSLR